MMLRPYYELLDGKFIQLSEIGLHFSAVIVVIALFSASFGIFVVLVITKINGFAKDVLCRKLRRKMVLN